MSRRDPAAVSVSQRPSDRLEELARQLEVLAADLSTAVRRLREETDHDPAE